MDVVQIADESVVVIKRSESWSDIVHSYNEVFKAKSLKTCEGTKVNRNWNRQERRLLKRKENEGWNADGEEDNGG